MEANLKDVVTCALTRCRKQGSKADILELTYAACLIEEQGGWGSPAADDSQQRSGMTLRDRSKLSEDAVAAMAERLAQHIVSPDDPAAAATAHLQLALERSYKQQQAKVEQEQSQQAAEASRLAAAVAYKKVNMQTAGLPDYQAAFEGVVDYVCSAIGVAARTSADAAARAQVSAAVESAFPLSGLAYFLTLPAQQRLQQMEALARVACGICLHNAYSGAVTVPLIPPSAATQLPQAEHLLKIIQAAAGEAEAAANQYNSSSNSMSSSASGSSSGSFSGMGVALFCCQAAVSLRQLAADLEGGIICCRALDEGVAAALTQASNVVSNSHNGVLKDAVFPLFESAGRLHLALASELRLLLVRARLWDDTCAALNTAAAGPAAAAPKVLGFKPRFGARNPGNNSCFNSLAGGTAASSAASGETPVSPTAVHGENQGLSAQEVAELPAYAEYVSPEAIAAGAAGLKVGDSASAETAAGDGAEAPEGSGIGQLALSGLCPTSSANSVAAAGGGGAAAGGSGRVLVGRLANPSIGYIRYGSAMYGFSSTEALQSFVDSPATILDAVRQAVHNTPLLAHMLGLTGSMAAAVAGFGTSSLHSAAAAAGGRSTSRATTASSRSAISRGPSPTAAAAPTAASAGAAVAVLPIRYLMELVSSAAVKVDAETQTPTHFIEGHIDVNYEWNEWALRRRIIALANLRTKATHSAQTVLSHFRRDGDSQTWQPKAAAVQTKVHKSSSMPRKLRHVTGLRGPPETKMKVVSLELDIGQTHQF